MFLLTRGFPKHTKITTIRGAFTSAVFPAILKTLFSYPQNLRYTYSLGSEQLTLKSNQLPERFLNV